MRESNGGGVRCVSLFQCHAIESSSCGRSAHLTGRAFRTVCCVMRLALLLSVCSLLMSFYLTFARFK